MKKNKPNLFILGAPKCGTTSLAHYLSQHPNVYVSPVKEPHFFNTDSTHRYYFNENDYLNLFKNAKKDHAVFCEASVWYLYSRKAIDAILKFNKDAKFIVMLRNPADLYFSLHQELIFGGSENVTSPRKAWLLQDKRRKGEAIPPGCSDPKLLLYGETCKLGAQVQLALDKINSANIHFITLDELKLRPDATFKKVLKFIEVPQISLNSYEVINPKKIRRYPALANLFIKINSLKKKLGITKGLGIASAINKKNVSYNKPIEVKERELLHTELIAYFYEDICLLESLVNKDLSNWKN
jgi:hypothetical protein